MLKMIKYAVFSSLFSLFNIKRSYDTLGKVKIFISKFINYKY